ncbi:IGSF1 protein, partial [Alectura lathami]|nr:IGSF1 protein [Alectura lathami]
QSDPVELVVTDCSLPPSSISLSSEGLVGTGTNVTIWCQSTYTATFFLHKEGCLSPVQREGTNSGDTTTTFTLSGVTPNDTSTYSCSYRPKIYTYASSPIGDSLTLEVTLPPAPSGRSKSPIWVRSVPSVTHGWLCPHIPSP